MSIHNNIYNYIYLLQEREFLNANENVFKVGQTKTENLTRFHQYPKRSVLLFQMICHDDCKNIEREVIKIFKNRFKFRKDIGNEYFEGEYMNMIEIIYSIITRCQKKREETHDEEDKDKDEESHDEEDEDEESHDEEDEEEKVYRITRYQDWIKYNDINKVIITKKNSDCGYLRYNGQLWRTLHDTTRLDFDYDEHENLMEFIEKNQKVPSWINKITNETITHKLYDDLNQIEKEQYAYISDIEYDNEQIYKDVIEKCYLKNVEYFNLDYHQYVLHGFDDGVKYSIFDSKTFKFTPVDELIHNKILTGKDSGSRYIRFKKVVNVDYVDEVLDSLVSYDTKLKFKELLYNLIVKQESKTIFYDFNECKMTSWVRDLLYTISGDKFFVDSWSYYNNKSEYNKLFKARQIRCVIINCYTPIEPRMKLTMDRQIKDFEKLGVKNIIVCQQDKKKNMYDIEKFRSYLITNKEKLLKCFKLENDFENKERLLIKLENDFNVENNDIFYDNDIFYRADLLLTNLLKWCCIK
jgi:hypothetical protein